MPSSDDKFYRARITRRVDVAPDLWSIRINPGGEFRFQPGQYATLGLETPEKRLERPYSIVSSPYESDIEFFLELVPHGVLTPELYQLQVGSELLMRKAAKGRFTMNLTAAHTNHLLVSTVTGLAPFLSYLRTLQYDQARGQCPEGRRVFLINGASRSWEFGYHEELANIASQSPWLAYVPTVSRPWEDSVWNGEIGRVDDVLRKYVDHWGLSAKDTVAYLCGHPQMIERSKGILERRGFPKAAIKEEVYWISGKEPTAKLAATG
jgi:ferredoxin--NADP+ reductase